MAFEVEAQVEYYLRSVNLHLKDLLTLVEDKVLKVALVLVAADLLSYYLFCALSSQAVLVAVNHVLAPVVHVLLRSQLLDLDDDDALSVVRPAAAPTELVAWPYSAPVVLENSYAKCFLQGLV